MFRQLAGTIRLTLLQEATSNEKAVHLQDIGGKTIEFVPLSQKASLVWKGRVGDEPALLILSLCSGQSFIGYKDA